ncbi:hypothetical protein [Croceicoccus hydrothermalis]|uniref:hypothetical protein n=1 Tax=Croceicoccus hydrothermalis TaxID=2867964 RepID=UPI001EFBACD9|nr:hypothetical protein [Croceicoccus hydrothermalis]
MTDIAVWHGNSGPIHRVTAITAARIDKSSDTALRFVVTLAAKNLAPRTVAAQLLPTHHVIRTDRTL